MRATLLALPFLCMPSIATAQVVISEIMYDLEGSDGGREWVEVYNESGAVVDLTEWKLFEGDTNHGLKALGASELPAGEYAVIADNAEKFKADWPSYGGLLFDSAFSLNNTGETLALRCCGKELSDVDSVSYSSEFGGAGDGATLARSGSSWVPTDPTPGGAPGAARSAPEPEEENEPPPEAKKLPEPAPAEKKKVPESDPTSEQSEDETVVAAEVSSEEESSGAPLPAAKPKVAKKAVAIEEDEEVEEEVVESEESEEESPAPESAQVAAVAAMETPWVWWVGAGGIALAGAFGAYFLGRTRSREWNIIDDSER